MKWELLKGEDACKADFGADNSGPYLTIVDERGDVVCSSGDKIYHPHPVNEANAARIVSCVNALAGMNPEAVKDAVEALEDAIPQLERYPSTDPNGERCENRTLMNARAALAALKGPK